jgi:hydrogenase small subunit
MNAGGACIGCTMPGFPDKFTPFYKRPPGSMVSTMTSRVVGSVIRPMRLFTNHDLNREVRWDIHGEVPSGWARFKEEPGPLSKIGHKFYARLRRSNDRGRVREEAWGRRREWTHAKEPSFEQRPVDSRGPVTYESEERREHKEKYLKGSEGD